MHKSVFIATALILGLSLPAFAGSCPRLSQQVTAALESSSLPADKKAEITALRDKGDQQHKSGQHDASVATLKQALEMLGK